MPPRKKARAAPSTPVADEDAMAIDSSAPQSTKPKESPQPTYDILKDPWTDEQESSLFKGLMKWKPNGMHKHFRMIALSEHLRNHGYDPRVEIHTRIPGIWQKLRTLYNMPIIDDRENSFEYEEDVRERFHEFELPPDDYDEVTFMRGKRKTQSEAGSSPPRLGRSPSPQVAQPTKKRKRGDTISNTKTRASTVDDTDEAKSPAHSPLAKTTRSGRSTNRSLGRVAAESSSRPPSRETTIDEDIGEAEEDAEETVEDEEETEEDGSNSPKASKATRSKAEPPATRKSRRKK